MPGDEVWILGERRSSGEQKYFISNLPADVSLKTLAAAVKARWICEQAHQQLKEELGLGDEKVVVRAGCDGLPDCSRDGRDRIRIFPLR